MKNIACIILACLVCGSSMAVDYYVSPTGSGGSSGTTNAPKDLQSGLDKLGPGTNVIMMPGLYTGQFFIYQVNGNSGTQAVVTSQYKWQARLTGVTGSYVLGIFEAHFIKLDGITITNALNYGLVNSDGSSGNTIANCWITYSGKMGMDFSNIGNSNNVIENCLVESSGHGVWDGNDNNRWHGVYLSGPNNIFRNNVVRNNGGWGLHYYAGVVTRQWNSSFYNNLTYGHTNFVGGAVWSASDSGTPNPGTNYVYGNTFGDGLQVALGTTWVTNNIILPKPADPTKNLYITDTATLKNDYNISTRGFTNDAVTQGAHDIVTNRIGLVSTNAGLFWLTSDSPARGTALSTVFGTNNFFGATQSSVSDLGAFQWSQKLERNFRRLDPSGTSGANYWAAATNASFYIGNLNVR